VSRAVDKPSGVVDAVPEQLRLPRLPLMAAFLYRAFLSRHIVKPGAYIKRSFKSKEILKAGYVR
jgi:hypothetical protein